MMRPLLGAKARSLIATFGMGALLSPARSWATILASPPGTLGRVIWGLASVASLRDTQPQLVQSLEVAAQSLTTTNAPWEAWLAPQKTMHDS